MYERIAKLVDRLHEKTEARAIAWEKSPSGNFQASFPRYTVELSQGRDMNVYVTIYNDEGDILERVSDKNLIDNQGTLEEGLVLNALYDIARRIALGSDEAIDNLISALED